MKNVIENQVVQMEFDNERFERNVHVSINSVKELQDTINMGSQTSNTLIDRLSAIDLSPLTRKIDALSDRFSTFGIVGMTIIQRITNAVIDLGIALESKVIGTLNAGWNQIITGGTSRAANIEQATFQLKGLFGEEVDGQIKLQMAMTGTADQIKELTGLTEDMIVADNAANYAVADTAYGLDSAAKAASQLAASGVDVIAYHEDLADSAGHMRTEMQVALRAISGTAAMTNSSYDEMAHIFATVAGNGRLMSEQLNSLGSRGLNAAATLANYFRETGLDANATEKSIREMVSKSQIDFMTFAKAMDEAYGEHAKDANSTFTGAFDNMRFALSKIGADFIAPLRDDMIPVLNNVRMAINAVRASLGPFLGAFKNASHYITDKLVEKFSTLIGSGVTDAEWKGTDQWNNAITNITEVVSTATDILKAFLNFIGSIVQPISAAWKEMFPSKGYEGFLVILTRIKEFANGLTLSSSAMDKVKRTAKGLFSIINIAKQIITPILGGIKELLVYFGILDADILSFTSDVGDALYDLSESGVIGESVQKFVDKLIEFIKSINEAIDTTDSLDISGFSFSLDSLVGSIKLFFSQLSESLSLSTGAQKVIDTLLKIINAFADILKTISGNFVTNPEQAGGNLLTLGEVVVIAYGIVKTFKEFGNIRGINADAFKQVIIAVVAVAASLMMLASVDPTGLRMALIALVSVFAMITFAFRIIANGFSIFNANLLSLSTQANGLRGLLRASFVAKITTVFDSFGTFLREFGTSLLIGSIGVSVWLVVKGLTAIVSAFSELYSQLNSLTIVATVIGTSLAIVVSLLMIIMKMYDNIVKQMQKVDAKDAIKVATGVTAMALLVNTCAEVIKSISGIDNPDAFLMGVLGLAAVFGAIFALYKTIENSNINNIDKQTVMLLGLSISIALIMKSVSSLAQVISESTVGMDSVLISTGVLLSIIVAIGILVMALNAFPASDGTMKALLAIATVLGTVALVGYEITQLAKIGWDQLKPVILSIAAIIGAVLALALIAAHIPIVDIALFAMAAAIASIGVAAAGIGAGLYLGARAIEILGNAIINLGKAWKENGPEIVEAMHATLTEMAQMLPYFISQMITGFVDGIKNNVETMMTLAPYLAQVIGNILIGVFNILAENIGPLTDAFIDFIVNLINSLGARLPDIYGAIANFIGPLFDGFVSFIGVFLNSAAESVGELLGNLLGGLIDGLTKSLNKVTLVEFAQQLADFMLTLEPFLDGLKGLDESTMNAAKSLAAVITIITANEIVRGLTSWLTGEQSLKKFGEELAEFGPYIKKYSDSVAGINVAAVEASTYAAQMVADFARTIPNEGGLLAKVLGDNDIAIFGEKLAKFGPYIKNYSKDVDGLDVEAVEASTYAAKMLADFARTIPNEGGLLAKITGDNDIETFGEHLKNFGRHISKYAEEVRDLDSKAVESSVAAALMLSEFANEIPNTGGLKAIFEGDNAVDKFGEQLAAFGKSILAYYDSISDMDTDILLDTTEALLGLFKVLGMADKVSTDSVTSMKDILKAVAEIGLKGFMDAIAVDSADDVEDAIDEFFENAVDIFKDNSKVFAFEAKLKGLQIALAYGEGMQNEEALEYVKKAADELGQASVKALEDSIDDPPEGAGETEPAGRSFLLGYGNGIVSEEGGLLEIITGVGQDSIAPLDLGDTTYLLGYNNMDQYRRGLEAAQAQIPKDLRNGSVFSMILNNTKPTRDPYYTQHEGYISPNYIPDPEPINAMSNAYRGLGDTLFDYQRATEEAEEETVDYTSAYAELEAAARNASSSINDVSSSSKKSGSSAKSAKTDFEKLRDEIKNVMDSYRDLWKDAKEQANKDLFKGVKDQGDDFLDDIKDIMSKYKNIYKSAIDQTNSEDLFAEVSMEDESFAPETLLNNLEDQVNQINELNTIISSLSGRIADEGLREAISKMSVDDLPQLRSLYRMNSSQLAEYENLYQQKVQANQNKIQNELTGLLSRYMGDYTDISSFVAGDAISNQLVTNLQAQIDKFNEYNTTMASLMDRIKDVKLREAIASMGIDSLEELKALNSMTDKELDNYVALYNSKITAGAQSIKTELGAKLSELLGEVTDIDQFYVAYVNGLTAFSEAIKDDESVKTAGQTAGKDLNSNITDGMSDPSSAELAGRKIIASTAEGLNNEDEIVNLTEKAQLIVDTIFGVLEDSYRNFEKDGFEIVHMVCRGIDAARKQTAVVSTVNMFVDTLQRTIESKYKLFVIIGQQIVKGIAEGMRSDAMMRMVEGAAISVATKAMHSAKEVLGIKSPSREFMKIGKFIDEGLALGLKEYSGLSEDASSEIAENTLLPVQSAINQLSGMLDGSIDINPTITPTLDLSQINAKSAALANMFNGRQIAVQAHADEQQAVMMSKLSDALAKQPTITNNTFNQTNNSPKALSRTEIYRQTKTAFSQFASAIS